MTINALTGVPNALGKGEVDSSILSGSTSEHNFRTAQRLKDQAPYGVAHLSRLIEHCHELVG
jgi:hypothetical protein